MPYVPHDRPALSAVCFLPPEGVVGDFPVSLRRLS